MQDENGPLSFGEWVQQRRQVLGLTRVALAEKVGCAEVTIKKIEREERRPSRQIAELLAIHLAIPDALRSDFLQMARGSFAPFSEGFREALRVPSFLLPDSGQPEPARALFIERQHELTWLHKRLSQALSGKGHPVFLLGDAGSGKTTTMVEFARRAQEKHPDLIVAGGQCNAQSGRGDPYRPFRDLLGMLTGDQSWRSWDFDRNQALRTWACIPDMIETLDLYGPDLRDLLLPAAPLFQRIAPYWTGPPDWLNRLQTPEKNRISATSVMEQIQILEQMTQVLKFYSTRHPLLLLVDDVQWADDASMNLLYHLGSRLAGSRVMLVCALRNDEASRPLTIDLSEGHSIKRLMEEFTRRYGDISLNLDQINSNQGWVFLNRLIDSEANHLDHAFRESFFQYTQGHPLFSIELLRHMEENQYLVRGADEKWALNQKAAVYPLPARVEAVIAQRLAMLPSSLHEILDVASVEGDTFMAEVVSTVLGLNRENVVRDLSRELEGRFRLVQELDEIQIGSKRLRVFRFRHGLYKEYLYNQLTQGERRHLHRASGSALEEIQQTSENEIKPPLGLLDNPFGAALVYHFWKGEMWEKAASYALEMGKIARAQFAMREAISYFDRAIQALDRLAEATSEILIDAILDWAESAYKYLPYDEQFERLTRAETLARDSGDRARLVQALHAKANVFLARGLWTRAGPALTECLSLAGELQNEQISVRPVFFKALMTSYADPSGSLPWIKRSLELSIKFGDTQIEALAFALKGEVMAQLGDFSGSKDAIRSAKDGLAKTRSPLTESDVDLMAAWAYLAMGKIEMALQFGNQSVKKAMATDNMDCICSSLTCIGYGNLELQRIPEAASAFEQGIERSEISGAMIPRLNGQAGLAMTQFMNGQPGAVAELARVIEEMHQYQNEVGAANARLMLANCLIQVGEAEKARNLIHQSIAYYRQTRMHPFEARAWLTMADLEDKYGNIHAAQSCRNKAGELMSGA